MNCVIYKGQRTPDTYLYVREGADEDVPEAVRTHMGELSKVMDIELRPERRLARADVEKVMENLREHGYYLQMPPPKELFGIETPDYMID